MTDVQTAIELALMPRQFMSVDGWLLLVVAASTLTVGMNAFLFMQPRRALAYTSLALVTSLSLGFVSSRPTTAYRLQEVRYEAACAVVTDGVRDGAILSMSLDEIAGVRSECGIGDLMERHGITEGRLISGLRTQGPV